MKGLDTIIKLRRRTLDELRRKMGALEGQKSQLQQLSAKLQEELTKEVTMAGKQPEMAQFFGGFAKRIKTRQEGIGGEIKALDKQIAKLADEISVAFSEVKKFEIAKENIKKRAVAKEARRETILLDEVAGQQHNRHRNEDA